MVPGPVIDELPLVDSISVLHMDPTSFLVWAQQKEDESSTWAALAVPGKSANSGGGKKNKVKKISCKEFPSTL